MSVKITDISPFKGETVRIDFDEGEPLFVHSDIVFQFHLRKDMNLPFSAIAEIQKANDTRRARERALYLLDGKDYSYVELFKKLEKNYSQEICFSVCSNLAESGIIDDRRYAEKLSRYYSQVKKFGFFRAREEMKKRGLSVWLIHETLEPYREEYCDNIGDIIAKKYHDKLFDEKGLEKTKAALVRMGHTYSDINKAIQEYTDNLEEE